MRYKIIKISKSLPDIHKYIWIHNQGTRWMVLILFSCPTAISTIALRKDYATWHYGTPIEGPFWTPQYHIGVMYRWFPPRGALNAIRPPWCHKALAYRTVASSEIPDIESRALSGSSSPNSVSRKLPNSSVGNFCSSQVQRLDPLGIIAGPIRCPLKPSRTSRE